MNCNCKKELEAKLTEHFKNNTPDASNHAVELKGYAIAIQENAMVQVGVMEYHATNDVPLKKGGAKRKTTKGNMTFNFCPFCGVKVKS